MPEQDVIPPIIAVDFDGTITKGDEFPNIGSIDPYAKAFKHHFANGFILPILGNVSPIVIVPSKSTAMIGGITSCSGNQSTPSTHLPTLQSIDRPPPEDRDLSYSCTPSPFHELLHQNGAGWCLFSYRLLPISYILI